MASQLQFDISGIIPSPILGGEGNIEFLGYLVKRKPQLKDWGTEINNIMLETYQRFQT
jgi:23S rRNA (cytidine1920-2'-O)/16S rRNA (cytidine1409-2'-O)-methyltransferase